MVNMQNYASSVYAASLAGKFLIASPYCMLNHIFDKSLIYLASHSAEGAVGVIVNHVIAHPPAHALLGPQQEEVELKSEMNLPIYLGGPVEPERGFVMHPSEESGQDVLLKLGNGISISSNIDLVNELARGAGPINNLFIMGYTAWNEGQLEQELLNNFWITSDYNEHLLYHTPNSKKWESALHNLGIDEMHFSSLVGSG